MDQGEVTDKGSVNQKVILRHHVDPVFELYSTDALEEVIGVSFLRLIWHPRRH
jgi:hypothetical protein